MYEKEIEKAQERLNAALSLAKQQPAEAVNMILDMHKWLDETLPNDSIEYYGAAMTYNEAMGDICIRGRQFVQAEQYYKKMVSFATKAYDTDKSRFDLRLAVAYCKLANNCATNIGCNVIPQVPRVLNEKTQRPFDAGENFYKVGIKAVEENSKKGSAKHLELQAKAINSLATMEAAVGRYKVALAMFEDAVKILKAIYQAVDNKNMAVALGTTLQNQATVATLFKDANKAQECLEDSIYVLKEHEDEDPVQSGVLIARNYMNLAGCLIFQKESRENVDAAYEKATTKISMVNAIARNAALLDEATCYMLAGQYYMATKREEKGREQLSHSEELIDRMLEKNPENIQLKNMKKSVFDALNKGNKDQGEN